MAESGTGKENLARAFHEERSPKGPFIGVNCGSLEAGRADVDLFGALKGAYTGAHATVRGHFDAAEHGTLFLDEIGELDLDVQVKPLRAIEYKLIAAVGGGREHLVDVGIVAATNVDLVAAVQAGTFRQDLYTRLSESTVSLPPLRDRPEEIPVVATLVAARSTDKPVSTAVIEELLVRAWRNSNHRSLVNVVANAARNARDDATCKKILPRHLRAREPWDLWGPPPSKREAEERVLSEAERRAQILEEAYKRTGSVEDARKEAGLGRSRAYEILGARGLLFARE